MVAKNDDIMKQEHKLNGPEACGHEGGRKREPARDTRLKLYKTYEINSTLEPRVDAETLKNVVAHSVATALASMVFPVPGGLCVKRAKGEDTRERPAEMC